MVRVVVVDPDTARLAHELEPTGGAAEFCKNGRRPSPIDTRQLEGGERARRVQPVVPARKRELDVRRLELPSPNDLRYLRQPPFQHRLDLGPRGERRVVVELDVRDDRD